MAASIGWTQIKCAVILLPLLHGVVVNSKYIIMSYVSNRTTTKYHHINIRIVTNSICY